MRAPLAARALDRSALVRALGIAVAAAVGLALAAPSARADAPPVYRWIDSDGIPHFTTHLDRVPSSVRDLVRESASPVPQDRWGAENAGPAVAPAAPTPAAAIAPPSDEFRESASPSEDAPLGTPVEERGATSASAPAPRGGAATGGETGAAGAAPTTSAPATAAPATVASVSTTSLDERIAALETEISRDEEALKNFLSEAPAEGAPLLPDRPEFREIAHRLPKLQAELARLRDERSRAGGR